MAARLLPARLHFPSSRSVRLCDFQTGSAHLQAEHRAWLSDAVVSLRSQQNFWIYIVGYASKLGKHGQTNVEQSSEFNRQLSYDRASEVARYLETLDSRVTARIREFSARGSDDYAATQTDDSSDERAVEVHVNYVAAPPPVPAHLDPVPLPGGARYTRWAVAAPAGVTVTLLPGVAVAANLIVFRCLEGSRATHAYLSPGAGAGFAYAGPSLSKLKDLIKGILSNLSYSGMSFTNAEALTPFNFRDLDGATCELRQAGVGAGFGYLMASASVRGQVWYRDKSGKMFGMREFLSNVNLSGKDLQLGVGGSVVGGPLIRVG